MSSFLLNTFQSFGNAPAAAAVSIETTRTTINTSTGTQDITIAGFGTPKAAHIVLNAITANDTETATAHFSEGMTDGTTQFCHCYYTLDAFTTVTAYKHSDDTAVAILTGGTPSPIINIEFSSWITDGIRLNITATNGNAHYITVTLFGGTDLSAACGVNTLATSGNTVTLTPGFQMNALFALGSGSGASFNETRTTTAVHMGGYATYDGSTIRQVAGLWASGHGDANGNPIAYVIDDGVITRENTTNGTVENITSTSFDVRSNNGTLADLQMGWMALNFNGSAESWAGMVDSPTTTGDADVTAPGFQPVVGFARPNMMTTLDAISQVASAGAFGVSVFTDSDEYSNFWTDQDGTANTRTKSTGSAKAIDMNTDAGVAAFDATFSAWLSTGYRLNYTTANGTVRKWPVMVIG